MLDTTLQTKIVLGYNTSSTKSIICGCIYTCIFADKVPSLDELMILKYTDKGVKKKVRIINTASHKWKDLASLICDDAHQISVLEQECPKDPNECLRQLFIHNFIDKKPLNYSQDWSGLIELLDDIGLEAFAKEVEHAIKSFTH